MNRPASTSTAWSNASTSLPPLAGNYCCSQCEIVSGCIWDRDARSRKQIRFPPPGLRFSTCSKTASRLSRRTQQRMIIHQFPSPLCQHLLPSLLLVAAHATSQGLRPVLLHMQLPLDPVPGQPPSSSPEPFCRTTQSGAAVAISRGIREPTVPAPWQERACSVGSVSTSGL